MDSTSIQSLFSELKAALTCSICFHAFDNPYSLGCNHTFCRKCINPLLKERSPTCPTCNLPFWSKDVVRNVKLAVLGKKSDELGESLQQKGWIGSDCEAETNRNSKANHVVTHETDSNLQHSQNAKPVSLKAKCSATMTDHASKRMLHIVFSGFSTEKRNILYQLVKHLNWNLATGIDTFSEEQFVDVRLVVNVIGAPCSRKCLRTTKYLKALAAGVWVLGEDWLQACAEINKKVNERQFAVDGDSLVAEKNVALHSYLRRETDKLFHGQLFYFHGHHHSRISKEDTALVIQLAGGSVIKAFDCNNSQPLIVICSNPKDCLRRQVYLPAQWKTHVSVVLHSSWVVECVARCKIQPFEDSAFQVAWQSNV